VGTVLVDVRDYESGALAGEALGRRRAQARGAPVTNATLPSKRI
jgi:hypothetical protein